MAVLNIGGVDTTVVDTGPLQFNSNWGLEEARLELVYKCAWDDRFTLRNALLGGVEFKQDEPSLSIQGYGYLARTLPHAHEEGEGGLFCTSARIEPHITESATDTNPRARYAYLRCTYQDLMYDVIADNDSDVIGLGGVPDEGLLRRYVERQPPKDKDRTHEVRGGVFIFTGTVRPVIDKMQIDVPAMERVYVWKHVPLANIPWRTIANSKSRANSVTFDGMAAGAAIFKNYSIEVRRIPSPASTRRILGANVSFMFEERPFGANSAPDPDRSYNWHPVEHRDGSGRVPYPLVDFSFLFRPEIPS